MFQKKLKDSSGSSMILAMALMLICVMVSSVIMAAASSGSTRNRHRSSQQQNFLAVSDATEFIVDNFNVTSDKFVGAEVSGKKACRQYIEGMHTFQDDPTTSYTGDEITVYVLTSAVYPSAETLDCYLMDSLCEENAKQKVVESFSFSGAFSNLMDSATKAIYISRDSYYEEKFELSVTDAFGQEEDRIPAVVCTFRMDADFDIEICVTSSDEDNDYTILIRIPAEVSLDNTQKQIVECKHKICHVYSVDNGAGIVYEAMEEYPLKYEVADMEKTIVTWGVPVVEKEVAAQ